MWYVCVFEVCGVSVCLLIAASEPSRMSVLYDVCVCACCVYVCMVYMYVAYVYMFYVGCVYICMCGICVC